MRFKTDMEALILGALDGDPLHGYAIVKRIKESSNDLFALPESQLYPLLHRMQNEGWIRGDWQTEGAGPARKVYTLLPKGSAELSKRREQFAAFSAAVGSLLTPKEAARG